VSVRTDLWSSMVRTVPWRRTTGRPGSDLP
jgi:hypothetical protein